MCIGQAMLIAGDLNADPAVIPCLAKGISACRYADLALAYSLGAGVAPDFTCRFSREDGTGRRRDFFVGCPGALATSQACYVTDRWFTPHFSVIARFRIDAWMADVACPVVCQPIWPAWWLDTPDRSSSSSTRIVQDVWDIYRDVLGVVPDEVVRALRDARSRRLGGRAVGGTASSRLYHVCQNDEVDKHCAQFFVNSSLSPVFALP